MNANDKTFYKQLLKYYNKHRRTPMSQYRGRNAIKQLMLDFKKCDSHLHSIEALTLAHIDTLLSQWKTRGNCDVSLIRRLSDIRVIVANAGVELTIPSNKALGLIEQKSRIPVSASLEPQQIQDNVIQAVCAIQYRFGLTKYEALQYHPFMHYAGCILVPRKIAFNSVDRWLNITREDSLFLKSVERDFPEGFITHASLKQVSAKHKAALALHGVGVPDYFRLRFIAMRHHALQQAATRSQSALLKTLRQQLGYSRNEYIKRALACQDVF